MVPMMCQDVPVKRKSFVRGPGTSIIFEADNIPC
jgi:hypothetical protein